MSDLRTANLPKRFYKTVSTARDADGYAVHLDGRPLRTPGRRPLAFAREALAEAVAREWEAQGVHVDPATMPVTRLSNTVVDGVAESPDAVRGELRGFAETDLLFYRADGPERLVRRQEERWDPVLRWAEAHVGGLFLTTQGIVHVAQPKETLDAIGTTLAREKDPFVLAALHQMTTLSGSLVLALAVRERHLAVDEAWSLAHLDEDWNIEQWGADDEAQARRAARFSDMEAGALLAQR